MLVPRNVFAVAKCADVESSRYALGGVRLERDADGKPVAIATDGRRLLAVQWPEAKPEEFPANMGDTNHVEGFGTIVPVKACEEARKGLGAKLTKRHKPILSNVLIEEPAVNGIVPMVATNLEDTRRAQPQSLDGRFPRWRDVVPQRDDVDGVSINLNARMFGELLLAMADVLGDDENNRDVVVTFPRDGADHAKAVTLSRVTAGGLKVLGVIMPLACDDKKAKAPKPVWLAAK